MLNTKNTFKLFKPNGRNQKINKNKNFSKKFSHRLKTAYIVIASLGIVVYLIAFYYFRMMYAKRKNCVYCKNCISRIFRLH